MDEQPLGQPEPLNPALMRRYDGDERRRPVCGEYDGIERRILDPLTEQDEDREPPPN